MILKNLLKLRKTKKKKKKHAVIKTGRGKKHISLNVLVLVYSTTAKHFSSFFFKIFLLLKKKKKHNI